VSHRARLTVLGDSFAEGRGDPRPDGTYGGWVPLFAELLGIAPGGYRNLGTHQATTTQILRRQLPAALVNKATVVGVVGGVNDLVSGYDPVMFRRNVAAILGGLAGPDTVLFTVTFPDIPGNLSVPASFRALLRDRFAEANDCLRQTATAFGALCLDFAATPAWNGPSLWDPDGLHPNPTGHRLFAEAMAALVGSHTGLVPADLVAAGSRTPVLSY
jgi:lysophospholipase L1-like esterase